jgi:hypothetical protein
MKIFIITLLLFFSFLVTPLFPQFNDIVCGSISTTENSPLFATVGGKYKPSANLSGQFFRVLFVFAQFQSDNEIIPGWPKGSLPDWASNIIDNVPASSYRQYTLSDYFKRMSKGQFDFIGDIHPNIITVQTNKAYDLANVDVINTLKTQMSDFKRYENWGFANNAFYFNERNADAYLDMIIIVYRWAEYSWFGIKGGVANLGFSSDLTMPDGTKIRGSGVNVLGSGITSKIGKWTDAFNITTHFAHEYGHYLFGNGHPAMGGLMMGDPWAYHGTYAMNAWERERLGYITLSNMYNGQPKTINDYVTVGDAIRINTNSSDPNEYLILENHQRLNYFDQVIRGGALEGAMDPNATLGKGLYVWYYKNGSIYPPQVWSIQADGAFNWQFVEYRTLVGWGGPGQPDPVKPVLDRGTSYRNLPNNQVNEAGRCDRNRLYFQSPTGWTEEYRWWDRDASGNLIISREPLGDETDAFKIGYNDQITPWSNPSSTKTSGATNISLKITNESNNAIELMYYNTYEGALNLPPSKPQNLKVTASSTNHPQLTWEANLEPDKSYYKVYKYSYSELGWQFLGIATTPYYQDVSETFCQPGQQCLGHNVMYRVTCLDTQSKESLPSDHVTAYVRGANQEKIVVNPPIQNLPSEYSLSSNYPNPFNPTTIINYAVKEAGLVSIKVYDILGSEIKTLVNETKEAGEYAVEFKASTLPSGIYIYTMQVNDFSSSKKMLLMK